MHRIENFKKNHLNRFLPPFLLQDKHRTICWKVTVLQCHNLMGLCEKFNWSAIFVVMFVGNTLNVVVSVLLTSKLFTESQKETNKKSKSKRLGCGYNCSYWSTERRRSSNPAGWCHPAWCWSADRQAEGRRTCAINVTVVSQPIGW